MRKLNFQKKMSNCSNTIQISRKVSKPYCVNKFVRPGAKKMTMPRMTRTAMTPQTMFATFLVRLWNRKLI